MSRSLDIYLYIIVHGEFTRHICIYICIYRVHSTYKYIRVSCLGMNVVWVTIYHRSDWGEYQEYWHISISRTRHMNTIRSYVEFTRHLHIYLCMSSSLDIRLCRYWKLSGLDIYTYIFMYVEFTRHTLVSSDRLHMFMVRQGFLKKYSIEYSYNIWINLSQFNCRPVSPALVSMNKMYLEPGEIGGAPQSWRLRWTRHYIWNISLHFSPTNSSLWKETENKLFSDQ